jgi:hypothetical protein
MRSAGRPSNSETVCNGIVEALLIIIRAINLQSRVVVKRIDFTGFQLIA